MIDKFEREYRFLSNFSGGHPITYEGEVYKTAEHLYQAMKTLDPDEQHTIRIAPDPGEAKRRGKRITLRKDWEEIKDSIMETVVRLKFEQPQLRQQLIDTGNQELIEGNWWGDTYYGVCDGVGENKLGLLLQKIRSKLTS